MKIVSGVFLAFMDQRVGLVAVYPGPCWYSLGGDDAGAGRRGQASSI